MSDLPLNKSTGAPKPQAVFILGMMRRSGTNYLYDLLKLHPDSRRARGPIWEDFLLHGSHRLISYVEEVKRQWDPSWGFGEEEPAGLYRSLGQGLLAFLGPEDPRRLFFAKTPSVENLDMFPKLFPHAKLIIVVRDGRAVVESGMKSFAWNFEEATHNWVRCAQTILNFAQTHRSRAESFRVIRYEDLWSQTREVMTGILNWLELDLDKYDFAAARHLPVRGSSVFRGGANRIHWEPVEKTDAFKPLERYRHWSAFRHQRFHFIAGPTLVGLGYQLSVPGRAPIQWRLWNRMLDWVGLGWRLRRLGRRLRNPPG